MDDRHLAEPSMDLSTATTTTPDPEPIEEGPAVSPDDARRTREIRRGIIEAGRSLRARHPWLERHQDALGLAIFVAASSAVLATWAAWFSGALAWWLTVPLVAFFLSFLHELEHDLIHDLYFRRRRWVNHLLLAGVWLFRPSTISPWVRRDVHLHHHRVSGTASDLEEQGITNGERWGLRRLLMTGDNLLAVYLRPFRTARMVGAYVRAQGGLSREERRRLAWRVNAGYFPLGVLHYALWHGFLLFHAVAAVLALSGRPFVPGPGISALLSFATGYAMLVAGPNALRTFALHFVSSNMHFFGDVEPGNIVQQCQVWRAWWLLPAHLFCFNFGATHAFHHFVVRDPFYVRQWLAPGLYGLLRDNGVRFNDFGTFRRANRLG